jgi:ABC-type Fe3+/spermidine/putrescine transport system ATPase subunit
VQEVDEASGMMTVATPFGLIRCLHEKRFHHGDVCKISVRPETASIIAPGDSPEGTNVVSGRISFASYIGNTIRYDIALGKETIFRVDVQNPWNQHPYPIDEKVDVSFPIQITLGIPA